jgi:hypothetical protein
MDLDFSLLTFSPSQRNLKSSGAGKSKCDYKRVMTMVS